MNPFNQFGFQSPFAFNSPSIGAPSWGFGGSPFFSGSPFNQNINTPFAGQFNGPIGSQFGGPFGAQTGAQFGNWNTPFNWNSGFNTPVNPGFSASPWNTPVNNNSWNTTPWNGFTPFSGFGGFSPFASFPFWGAQSPAGFWNANNTNTGAGFNQGENTPFNASVPVANGAFPFGFPFFAPGAFGPFGGIPSTNGEATPARNAA